MENPKEHKNPKGQTLSALKDVVQRGDDAFIGTSIRQGPSVLKKEIRQLVNQGYRPKEQGSKWLIKE
jgi:hypothetical protein